MRWKEINEAPLADFGAYGDLNTAGSFNDNDLKALRNDKWLEKVKMTFSRTPFDFRLYVINAKDGIITIDGKTYNVATEFAQYHGTIHPIKTAPLLGKVLHRPDFEQSINVLLTHNYGDELVSFTPWIVAHRVAHALSYGARQNRGSDLDNAMLQVRGAFENFYIPASKIIAQDESWRDHFTLNKLGQAVFTFRSARTGNVRDLGEMVVELMTQYIVTGSVKANYPDFEDIDQQDQFNALLDKFLKDFNGSMRPLLVRCIGKVFIL